MPLPMGLKDIAKKYRMILRNGAVLSNRHSMELLDQRVGQLLERIDQDDTPDRIKALYDLFQDVKAAQGRNEARMYASLNLMDIEFEKVYHDYEAWNQIIEILDMRRKLVDSEVKVIKDMKAILTAEQAKNLVGKLLAVCIEEVRDPKALRRINYKFARLIGENDLEDVDEDVIDLDAEKEDE